MHTHLDDLGENLEVSSSYLLQQHLPMVVYMHIYRLSSVLHQNV